MTMAVSDIETQDLLKSIDAKLGSIVTIMAKNANVAENTTNSKMENVAEQRKWIGKLCRFRDKDYKDDQWDYGLLQAVEKAETAHIWKTGCFKHNLGHWYDICEPVKPDSEIIYHGE